MLEDFRANVLNGCMWPLCYVKNFVSLIIRSLLISVKNQSRILISVVSDTRNAGKTQFSKQKVYNLFSLNLLNCLIK